MELVSVRSPGVRRIACFALFAALGSACSANSDAPNSRGTVGAGGSSAGAAGTDHAGQSGVVGGSGDGAGAGAGGVGASAGGGGAPAAGTGGSSGSSLAGASGSAGGASTPCGASGLLLCDDFEARTPGMQPMAMPWAASNCFDMAHVLKVDGALAHSGSLSLVSQGIPYADCQMHADLGTQNDFYVRAWVYYAAGSVDQFEAHEVTVFELVPAASTDDPAIRVGFRGNTCLPEGVELNITGGMEQTGCTGVKPVADRWTCYELHVQSSAAGTIADLSIGGMDQSYMNHGSPQLQILNPDLKSVRYLRLGARSYSGSYAPLVYVDDIAVGTLPIGCQ